MSHAECCPVCNGSGQVRDNLDSTCAAPTKMCHGCGGLGWVVVQDAQSIPSYIPQYIPYREPNPWWRPNVIWTLPDSNLT